MGGGVASGDDVTFVSNTIARNYSSYRGGGIYFWEATQADTFKNNILWGNVAPLDSQIYAAGQAPSIIYDDIQGGYTGEGNIDVNPQFVDFENFDFHLLRESPCIDAGDPDSPPDPDSTRADMGALPYDHRVNIEQDLQLPGPIFLLQNHPNPFNSSTSIGYELPHEADVSIEIFDIAGRRVDAIHAGKQAAGRHSASWDANGFSSGVYLYRLKAGEYSETRKALLLK
jgi:hypothetical protein